MLANIKLYAVIGLIIASLGSIIWGLYQKNLCVVTEARLSLAQKAIAERDVALAAAQKQYDNWLIAAKEREARLQAESDASDTILKEVEDVKKIDSTAAEYGAGAIHPAYLERLYRNAEGS